MLAVRLTSAPTPEPPPDPTSGRTPGPTDDVAVADAVRALVIAAGAAGVEAQLEANPATAADDRVAAAAGLPLTRDLVQLRCALPLAPAPPDPAGRAAPAGRLRGYRPGQDEDGLLAVNNAAFAWHPEQSGWTRAVLAARMAEPWFDAAGLLVWERDGAVVGFCWTKVHAHEDPPLGEIFVIGVHPDQHGQGLGEVLVRAGLDHLAGGGLAVGMLWTEADNHPAMALYRRLGFEIHQRHRWWGGPAVALA